ncbi:tyrosine-protein phosphatase CpsB [Andreesenia angusta]|uniref:protein-tyrosine-phosphatase n=1 Tax=Andreesenia angusta TaxID=39480 RepID=A0A1S1V6X3_9FIRM|nr:CpsB/CapC family capsule biosynthesis tyrosine phosphatase [Andreesenia angusta]OHW61887.1 tyrosine-protein phosphatase CpsB [Andreesenia angusta]
MIDIHCHIVPGVDDGPDSAEEAKQMIEMMYNDGIRGVVATSHRNHPLDFGATRVYEESLAEIKSMASELYPGFKIYSGAEFFVRDGYLEILDSPPYDFTIEGTDCVLLEFESDATYEKISDAVYEFTIRGFKPVIAHIDKYRDIWSSEENIEKLRDEGAYIQITGATLVGKYGNTMESTMKKLLKKGHIDFIGSDGHSPEKRKPLLKRAYRVVSRICSRAEADRLFVENPSSMLSGKSVEKKESRSFTELFLHSLKLSPIVVITVFIIGAILYYFLGS